MFRSHAAELYALTGIPPLVGSKLVLGPKEIDISGGDELRADTDVFAKLPINGASPPRHLYWQKTATNGVHWAVAERAMGWHGDMYSLFAVPHGRNPDALFAKYFGTETADGLKPLIDDNWRPPLMIQDTSGAVWAIDVGEPFIPLGSWDVYVADSGRARQACTIAFRPDVRDITTLLPAPVRRLASLLDQTIGPGTNEGTLHPTAQLRIDVAHTWANVALRPWAVSHQPYNTRHDVDVALKTWAGRAPGFAAVYHSIEAQYPAAQRALGVYYRMHFHKPQKAAKQSAAYALGIAFRSYFVFHREGSQASPTPVSANPWR
ncbi:MAG TPA: hypothetical protein VHW69_08440 [Rhizomicrobium sp.]|nr:hypothetical protein [Rhizomicrobium sp.]